MKTLSKNLLILMSLGFVTACSVKQMSKQNTAPAKPQDQVSNKGKKNDSISSRLIVERKEVAEAEQVLGSKRTGPTRHRARQMKLAKKKMSQVSYDSADIAYSAPSIKGYAGGAMPTTIAPPHPGFPPQQEFNTESYEGSEPNRFIEVGTKPLSTFSIDVDTASYANMRRFINRGSLPYANSVRVEEMINYFDYEYSTPRGDHPFAVKVDATTSPWNKDYKVVRVALKGKEIKSEDKPASNIVFLLDVSGSMHSPNKLPLLQGAMKKMVRKLTKQDRVAIVVYAGRDAVVLDSTEATDRIKILKAIDSLRAGGGTNASAGIATAYKIAKKHFIKGGVNRIVLGTDGDFNLGTTNRGDLHDMIKEYADAHIFLTVLGFGMGNYKDSTLEFLTNKGNGNYFYIDTMNEADKVLNKDLTGTLVTIAKDVKIQVEFNPGKVQAYRLVGYENRKLKDEDFNDDKKDAGEIGAGHTVTALYEIVPTGAKMKSPKIDSLKYQKVKKVKKSKKSSASDAAYSNELLTVKLRYKKPEGKKSRLLSVVLKDKIIDLGEADEDLQFAIAVASFGMHLRKDEHIGRMKMKDILALAKSGKGNDRFGYRDEFIDLVGLAGEIR